MGDGQTKAVGDRDEFADESGTTVEVDGNTIAVFMSDGDFYAVEHTCPHQGGPLGNGKVEGTSVYCPWHGYEFDLTTGEQVQLDDLCVETYPVHVERDTVYVSV